MSCKSSYKGAGGGALRWDPLLCVGAEDFEGSRLVTFRLCFQTRMAPIRTPTTRTMEQSAITADVCSEGPLWLYASIFGSVSQVSKSGIGSSPQ